MPVIRLESEDDDAPWPDDDFTGEWVVEWPNGQVKFRSDYANGNEEGDYFCYWANGNLAQRGMNKNGVCIGLWEDYWENGKKFKETDYDGADNFIVRWIDDLGSVERVQIFRDGLEQEPNKQVEEA